MTVVTCAPSASALAQFAGTVIRPAQRGRWRVGNGEAVSRLPLPTDAIGNFALTLTNVVPGSAVQVEDQAGTTVLHNSTAASSTVSITLFAYAGGSPLNDLRIKVRKGSSAPFYRPFETLATAVVGAASIYVAQIQDD